jgi:hypothetical protein
MATKESADIFLTATSDAQKLTQTERLQYQLQNTARLRNIENAFLLLQEGVIDDDVFKIFAAQARQILRASPEAPNQDTHTSSFYEWLEAERSKVENS